MQRQKAISEYWSLSCDPLVECPFLSLWEHLGRRLSLATWARPPPPLAAVPKGDMCHCAFLKGRCILLSVPHLYQGDKRPVLLRLQENSGPGDPRLAAGFCGFKKTSPLLWLDIFGLAWRRLG